MKITVLAVSLSAALASASLAQTPAESSPEKTAVMANDKAYEAAYAKADVKAMADFFTDDADYTTAEGQGFSGRAEIEEAIRAGLAANRGGKLTISVDTVRLLGPETAVEKGTTTTTAKNGEESSELYTAIHIKKDGKWKISQLIESPVPDATPHEHLTELDWLVGDWQEADKEQDLKISSQYNWARGGNFLTRNITVKKGGEVTLEGWQIIGWDPVEERIRTWTFDGEGGFSDGYFTREGDRWLLKETGVTPDGDRTSAENTFTKVSDDRFTWESNNRTLDGEPQPSIDRIEVSRVKGN
jgi:uncharacterized protein (TIGR02246 family)